MIFLIWNEVCKFCNIMSYRMISSFLLCCEPLDYVKFMFSYLLCVIWYDYVLLVGSLFFEVFVEWQVSLEDGCCPSGGEYKIPKMT